MFTMCSGDAQELSDLRMIPASSSLQNSSLHGHLELVQVQAAGFGEYRAAHRFHNVLDAVFGVGVLLLVDKRPGTLSSKGLPVRERVSGPPAGQPAGWLAGGLLWRTNFSCRRSRGGEALWGT